MFVRRIAIFFATVCILLGFVSAAHADVKVGRVNAVWIGNPFNTEAILVEMSFLSNCGGPGYYRISEADPEREKLILAGLLAAMHAETLVTIYTNSDCSGGAEGITKVRFMRST